MNEVLVVDKKYLSKYLKDGIFSNIRINYQWNERTPAEVVEIIKDKGFFVGEYFLEKNKNPHFKRILLYSLILRNGPGREVFVYRHASNGHCDEKRLRGKWSLGFSDYVDCLSSDVNACLCASFAQKIKKETMFKVDKHGLNILGIINEPGSLFLGVVNVVFVGDRGIARTSEKIADGKFYSFAEAERIIYGQNVNSEAWSKIIFPSLKLKHA